MKGIRNCDNTNKVWLNIQVRLEIYLHQTLALETVYILTKETLLYGFDGLRGTQYRDCLEP